MGRLCEATEPVPRLSDFAKSRATMAVASLRSPMRVKVLMEEDNRSGVETGANSFKMA